MGKGGGGGESKWEGGRVEGEGKGRGKRRGGRVKYYLLNRVPDGLSISFIHHVLALNTHPKISINIGINIGIRKCKTGNQYTNSYIC